MPRPQKAERSAKGEAQKPARNTVLHQAEMPRLALITLGFGLFRGWSVVGGSPTLFVPAGGIAFAAEASMAFPEDVACCWCCWVLWL